MRSYSMNIAIYFDLENINTFNVSSFVKELAKYNTIAVKIAAGAERRNSIVLTGVFLLF